MDDVSRVTRKTHACFGRDAVESVGVRVQVLCRVLKRAEEFGENTVPEQYKQEGTQKTAG